MGKQNDKLIKNIDKMNKVIIEDWFLEKEYLPSKVWNRNKGHNGGYINDFHKGHKSFRVVGTESQIKNWSDNEDFILDEVYKYEEIKKGSYWDGIICGERSDRPTRAEYNAKFNKDLEEYKELYTKNNNNILILRTA